MRATSDKKTRLHGTVRKKLGEEREGRYFDMEFPISSQVMLLFRTKTQYKTYKLAQN